MMKIDIVERRSVRVVCLRYTGPFGEPLGRFWRNTVVPWLADHDLTDCPRLGVIVDSPGLLPPERCRYDAGIELPPGLSVPDAPEVTIEGGRYAVTRFKGVAAEIGPAWSALVAEFLADPAHRIDGSRPPLEYMPRGALHDARTGVFACELCLPMAG
jgi:AraC family transcriptional regulator